MTMRRFNMGAARLLCGVGVVCVAAVWSAPVGARVNVATARSDNALAGKVIVIDPGHNGGNARHTAQINRPVFIGTGYKACDTTGTATDAGYPEYRFTLDVARRVARILRARGATVVMTRTSSRGWGPCIDERARIGNRAHADAAISIHGDGGPASGHPARIVGLTDDIAAPSRNLANRVRRSLIRGGLTPATYIGQRGMDVRGDLGGLNLSDVPKVFVELGNMRNHSDAHNMRAAAWRQHVAARLARALIAYAR
mgnify:CR=1 FL=1